MSSFYYKVTPETKKTEVYGFKKVNKSELRDIVSRLSRPPNYNGVLLSQESNKTYTLQPRPASTCSRLGHGYQSGYASDNRRLTERELQRLLRRVRKPTLAHLLSRTDYEYIDRDLNSVSQTATWRPSTAGEREKLLQHLSRPTTASRAKHALECYLCSDDERELNKTLVPFEYLYADDKDVTNDEVNCIVSRLSSATRASDQGSGVCCRLSPDYGSLHVQSMHLPLVSGLARSKNVAEIVSRLHSSKGSRRAKSFHGYSTTATQITDYNI